MAEDKKMAEGVAAPTASIAGAMSSPLATKESKPENSQDVRAAQNIRNYLAWKSINSQGFRLAEAHAVERAKAGGVVSGAELVNWIRAHDVVNDLGLPSRPNNDYAAPLIRDICLQHPVVRPHVEMRTGVYDRLAFMFATGGEVW